MEEERLALEMALHVQDDHPEKRLKNAAFSPQNGPPRGSMVWKMFHSTTLCNHFIARTLRKKNGPNCGHLFDTLAIVLNFQDDRLE